MNIAFVTHSLLAQNDLQHASALTLLQRRLPFDKVFNLGVDSNTWYRTMGTEHWLANWSTSWAAIETKPDIIVWGLGVAEGLYNVDNDTPADWEKYAAMVIPAMKTFAPNAKNFYLQELSGSMMTPAYTAFVAYLKTLPWDGVMQLNHEACIAAATLAGCPLKGTIPDGLNIHPSRITSHFQSMELTAALEPYCEIPPQLNTLNNVAAFTAAFQAGDAATIGWAKALLA
jgi:hypothetical protein